MVTDLFDWVQNRGDFAQQGGVTKFELALLAKISGVLDHSVFNGLTVEEPVYKAGLHWCMPARFAMPGTEVWNVPYHGSHSPDDVWLWPATHNEPPPTFQIVEGEHPVMLAHRVYWSSFYGQELFENTQAAGLLLDAFNLTDDPDDIARLLMALHILGEAPPTGAEDMIATGIPLSWYTFHKHLTAELYRSMAE